MTTLYTFPGNFRAFKALVAAEYNGIDVSVEDFTDEAAALSPLGKAPVLQTPSGVVFESNAIARYLARARADTELLGASFVEQAQVDSWIDFSANELELPASMWTYPVLGYMPFNLDAYNKAKGDLAKGLKTLDAYLLTRTYLVGEKISLADICVTSALVYVMKFVADKTYLKPFGNVVRYYTTCVNQPEFKAVIGEAPLCKEEMLAPGAPKPAKKEEPKKAAKKDKKKAADAPPPAPKKTEHPYKIMDKEAPSKFSMDSWKKAYSNAATYEAGMEYFWTNIDLEGWSVWHQIYNYNEENKRTFMASNAIGGFQQRSDEVRKWAFGVMDLVGSEPPEGVLEIKGVWLLRGDTVDHLKQANDDANWYTWTKLCGPGMAPTDAVKKQVFDYWCQENELEGKPIQDSKVFK